MTINNYQLQPLDSELKQRTLNKSRMSWQYIYIYIYIYIYSQLCRSVRLSVCASRDCVDTLLSVDGKVNNERTLMLFITAISKKSIQRASCRILRRLFSHTIPAVKMDRLQDANDVISCIPTHNTIGRNSCRRSSRDYGIQSAHISLPGKA